MINLEQINFNLSNTLSEKFATIFPNWITIITTILSFLVLLITLTFLVWKPVKDMVKKRQKYIQDNINFSKQNQELAALDRQKANQELIEARIRAENLINQARSNAEDTQVEILIQAKKQTQKMLKTAQEEIMQSKTKLVEQTKQEIVEVALKAASKIVEKEIDSQTNRKLVEKFIKQI